MFELPTIDPPIESSDDRLADLPDGFRMRPYAGEADIPAIVDIANRQLEYDKVPFRWSLGDAISSYRHPGEMFDPARDVTIAEIDGVPVGYGDRSWVDTTLENF